MIKPLLASLRFEYLGECTSLQDIWRSPRCRGDTWSHSVENQATYGGLTAQKWRWQTLVCVPGRSTRGNRSRRPAGRGGGHAIPVIFLVLQKCHKRRSYVTTAVVMSNGVLASGKRY